MCTHAHTMSHHTREQLVHSERHNANQEKKFDNFKSQKFVVNLQTKILNTHHMKHNHCITSYHILWQYKSESEFAKLHPNYIPQSNL